MENEGKAKAKKGVNASGQSEEILFMNLQVIRFFMSSLARKYHE